MIMNLWQHLIVDVIYAVGDKKSIRYVAANGDRILHHIKEDELLAYLKQLSHEGWDFVHVHTMDELYSVYYFKRRDGHNPKKGDYIFG